MPLKFIDLFSGIGGFHIGIKQLGGECVLASEIDETAADTYYNNFQIKPMGDIRTIESSDIPEFDLLCAGFPCQSFSQIGNKKGLADPRGVLVYEVFRILKDKTPKAFILENVKGLLSQNGGQTFNIIKNELEKCGYDVYYQVLKANDFQLPQLRQRLFIVGIDNKYNKEFEFPRPQKLKKKLSDVLKGETERELAFTIRVGGRKSGIDSRFNWDCYKVNNKPRYITVSECLELQGFPREFNLSGSESAQFKQVGNAVPTTIVKEIGVKLLETGVLES